MTWVIQNHKMKHVMSKEGVVYERIKYRIQTRKIQISKQKGALGYLVSKSISSGGKAIFCVYLYFYYGVK